ncbi:hypothetical protein AB205_0183080, partial [Aquarana catesbeiana]
DKSLGLFISPFYFLEKSKKFSPPPKKRCASCKAALREALTKLLWKTCKADLVREETSTKEPSVQPGEMLTYFWKELEDMFQSFHSYLDKRPVAQSAESSPPSAHTSSTARRVVSESEEEEKDESSGSDGEKVEDLLKTIYTTLNIKEDKTQLLLHDKMYQGMDEVKHRVFPVHKVLTNSIKRKWKDPERAPFFSRSLKRRFLFEDSFFADVAKYRFRF